MTFQKGVKFRIYPNREQRNLINRTLGCSRLIYNKGLAMRKDAFKSGENVNGVLVKVIGEPSRTAAAFLVDVFCYDEMLRVTYLYYERLRKQSKSKTKIERK